MLAREELARAAPGRGTAVTIGKFDGVHRGHQYLIGRLIELARAQGLASVVVTFNPHPITVLRPGTPATYLCSLEERVELLRGLGVDSVAIVSFTSQLAQLSARDFIALLKEELGMQLLLVGPDFALGRNREGDVQRLRALGEELGYQLEVVPLLSGQETSPRSPFVSEEKVGSRAIRAALAVGNMEKVAELLGRPFSLRGPVVKGAARGKALGFPTVNIAIGLDQALPAFGIYVTLAHACGQTYPAATSIGIRPTFEDPEPKPTVEAYLLDFEGDLYGQEVRLELLHRLRGEKRFPSPEALIAAMKGDIEDTRRYFHART